MPGRTACAAGRPDGRRGGRAEGRVLVAPAGRPRGDRRVCAQFIPGGAIGAADTPGASIHVEILVVRDPPVGGRGPAGRVAPSTITADLHRLLRAPPPGPRGDRPPDHGRGVPHPRLETPMSARLTIRLAPALVQHLRRLTRRVHAAIPPRQEPSGSPGTAADPLTPRPRSRQRSRGDPTGWWR